MTFYTEANHTISKPYNWPKVSSEHLNCGLNIMHQLNTDKHGAK